jgi:hypothetical protein
MNMAAAAADRSRAVRANPLPNYIPAVGTPVDGIVLEGAR